MPAAPCEPARAPTWPSTQLSLRKCSRGPEETKADAVTQTGLENRTHDNDGHIRATSGTTRMRTLAETYPELGAFTPDATLTEIKIRYGLDSFAEVLELGRRRSGRR